jgi:hypothetical protein
MCNFSIEFTSSAKELVNKLRNAITQQGGNLEGDTQSGTFTVPVPVGNISGHYTIVVHTLNVTIHHRPIIVSCARIEQFVRNFLSEEDNN